jgi:hypothetical protein
MKLAPIILFVYNRPKHTKKTVEALKKNKLAKESILYVFSDGPKKEDDTHKIKKVREYIHTIKGFKETHIIERKQNYGLAKSIIEGVTEVISKHRKVIVLEDDLVTSHMFLTFMNHMLETYEKEKKIYSITGYNYPPKLMKIPKEYKYDIYFSPRAGSWGWATWKDRWNNADWEIKDYEEFKNDKQLQKEFNKGGDDRVDMLNKQMEGKLDAWSCRWNYSIFKNQGICIYPVVSYVQNIGLDNTGVHCSLTDKYSLDINTLNKSKKIRHPKEIGLNPEILKNFKGAFKISLVKKFILSFLGGSAIHKFYRKLKYKNETS